MTTLYKRQESGDVKRALPKIVVLFVLSVIFPALIEALWIENILHIGWAVVFAGYIIFSVMLFLQSKTNEMV
ncbi:MAG: hypothetical protein K6E51_12090 [Treponema sp.]|nr:hypothetical protein [Treponema sp.]